MGHQGNGKYFYTVEQIQSLFHKDFAERRVNQREKPEFTIRDPFNNTYNPAKVLTKCNYRHNFQTALETLFVKKLFIVDGDI